MCIVGGRDRGRGETRGGSAFDGKHAPAREPACTHTRTRTHTRVRTRVCVPLCASDAAPVEWEECTGEMNHAPSASPLAEPETPLAATPTSARRRCRLSPSAVARPYTSVVWCSGERARGGPGARIDCV